MGCSRGTGRAPTDGRERTVNEIEFLPKRFREKQRHSNIKVSRWLVLSLLLGVMALVSLCQLASLHHVRGQLATLKTQHDRIAALLQEVDKSRSRLTQMRHHARLQAFLDHPYPKSQIIAEVTNPLPAEIVITRIELARTLRAADGTRAVAENASDQGKKGHPMELDLKQLVSESERRQCTLEIEGTTSDTSSLYTFLATLHESDIVQSAKLESIDPQTNAQGQELSSFTAHVNIEQGHLDAFQATLISTLEMNRRGASRE